MNHELIKQQAEDAPLHKWHSETVVALCDEIAALKKELDELEGLLRDSQCEHKRCMEALDAVMRGSLNAPIGEATLAKLGAGNGGK